MLFLLLAAALELPLQPRVSVRVPTLASRLILAPSGDRLLGVWQDYREQLAIYAARMSIDGRLLDRQPIRIVPPPDASYDAPTAAALADGYAVAFVRRHGSDFEHREVLLQRIGLDGALLEREPRLIASGDTPRLASNGTTSLLLWQQKGTTQGRLFTTTFDTAADLSGLGDVAAVIPQTRGYLVGGKGGFRSVGDDGTVGDAFPFAAFDSIEGAPAVRGALVVYTSGGRVSDALLDSDGRTIGSRDLGGCSRPAVTGVTPYDVGFLALVACEGATQFVMPPPLPVYATYTIELGALGELGRSRLAAERTFAYGLVSIGRTPFAAVNTIIGAADSANVARVAAGRLFPPTVLSVGQPWVQAAGLIPTEDGALALWIGDVDVPLTATKITPNGIDRSAVIPAAYGGVVASNGRELLVNDRTNHAHVTTLDGKALHDFAIPWARAAGDRSHWLFAEQRDGALHVTRMQLDGSAPEEITFDTVGVPHIQCNDGGCFMAWSAAGDTVRGVLVRADKPLRDASPRQYATNAMFQFEAVGASSDGFLLVVSHNDGSVRASVISATDGAVRHEVELGKGPAGVPPYPSAGGGADGFEVVANTEPMTAFRIGSDGTARNLGARANGIARFVTRSKGRGYVVYERDRTVFATITE